MRSTGGQSSLADVLANDVSHATRQKGHFYFLKGAVTSLEERGGTVIAQVRGTRIYDVTVTRSGDAFTGTCDCPYLADRLEICKHIWAVVLAADRQGWLQPASGSAWIDAVSFDRGRASGSRVAPAPPPRPEPWELFLRAITPVPAGPTPAPANALRDAQIAYVMNPQLMQAAVGVPVVVQARHRKKNGEWGHLQPVALKHDDISGLSEAEDREILPLLLGASDPYGTAQHYAYPHGGGFFLKGPLLDSLLPRIARTGRLYFRPPGPRQELSRLGWDDGPPWQFVLDVRRGEDSFILEGALVREGERKGLDQAELLLQAGYLASGGLLARFDARGPFSMLNELRQAGSLAVPLPAAPRLTEALAHAGVEPASLPEELFYEVVEATPRPCASIARPDSRYANADLRVAVSFEYEGTLYPPDMRQRHYDADRRRLLRRDHSAEQDALTRIQQLGVRRQYASYGGDGEFVVNVNVFPTVVRTLVHEGWRVDAEGRVFRAPQHTQVQVKSGVDWFELHGRVDFGEGRSASLAELLDSLRRGEASVPLDDGTRGMLPEEWLRRYMRIASFGEVTGDHVRYRQTQTALLDALLEGQPAISVDEAFTRARQELQAFTGIRPVDPPRTFKGTLREYQREALGWFAFLRQFGFGGCLADDMGLGKTVMVLALLESRRTRRERDERLPSLAVVPRSLVFNWKDEAARFAPKLRVLDHTGTSRDVSGIPEHDLVLTTYGTLRRDAADLTQLPFDYVILDEAQAIKNPSTAAAKAARLLRGRHRLALSGTPIENHVGELWSLFEFLNPGLLGTASGFRKVSSAAKSADEDLAIVTRAVRPMILRRTKAQVEPQLPARTEQTIVCEMEGPQRKFYDRLRDHYRATLLAKVARGGIARSKLQVLEALLRLRQAACHAGLVDPARLEESSAKLDALLPQLQEATAEGHKALVFSQFTSFLAIVRERLDGAGLTYEYLDGQTRDRAERVQRFNADPDCRIFLISLKAGGVGLNLTSAEYVFLLDPWWNPAVEAQAIDRAHRIGQSKHVFAYRLIARDTVEEKVAELQQQKRELADAILTADPTLIKTLTAEDLDWLLG